MLESFRPGVLDRLGCGYEALREVNPAIVYCAISGYGQDSPLRDRSGHDLNYLALAGLLGLTGDATARRSSPRARSPTSAAARSWPRSGSSRRCASATAAARASSSTSR